MSKNPISIAAGILLIVIIALGIMILFRGNMNMEIKSVFANMERIPEKYSCDGENINPRLEISNIPKNAKSLALIMHDPDAPREGGFTHWVVWNIPVSKKVIIEEDSFLGVEGKNGANESGYRGPCPPSGVHRYFFTFYALDRELSLGGDSTKVVLENAMLGHVISKGELVGVYSRGD